MDAVPGIHVEKQMLLEEDQAMNLASVCSKPLALSAAMDMRMRRYARIHKGVRKLPIKSDY